MKRVLQILLLLFVFYYTIQLVFDLFDKGYEKTYTRITDDKEVTIKEVYQANKKNERDNYFFEIKVDDTIFYLKIYDDFKKMKNIITDIKYLNSEDYKCILPIFKNEGIITDIICKNNNLTTYYSNIKDINKTVDNFANSIEGYNVGNWLDDVTETTKNGNVFVYGENIIKNLYLGLTSYKGIYNINDQVSKNIIGIDLFKNDVYSSVISTQINNKYLVANYNSNYEFTEFYLTDLTSKEYEKISGNHKISFNSYIQGVIENNVYLIDIDNKKQYQIDVNSKKIIEIGNENTGIKYYNNGNCENRSIFDAINSKLIFTEKNIDASTFTNHYERIDLIGGKSSGYYYLYEKSENKYKVYKSYVEMPNQRIYLFSVPNIDKIKYVNDIIILVDGSFVKIYSENFGMKNIIKYDELNFNNNINIYAYYKK